MATKPKQCIGDGDVFTVDGKRFRCRIEHDPDMGPPWEKDDGHGIISEWTDREPREGELVLARDHHRSRYYDIDATIEVARKDGWGIADKAGKSPEEITVAAVQQDYERMKAWCDDEWTWVGVIVELLDKDGHTVGHGWRDSVWGIESDSDAGYFDEVARECAGEILHRLGGKDVIELPLV